MTIRQERHYDSDLLGSTMLAMRNAIVALNLNVAGAGNGADQTEDVLATYSLPAKSFTTLALGGIRGVLIQAFGHFGTNGDNKQAKLYFGATSIATGVVTSSNKNWFLELMVLRTGASTQIITGLGQTDVTPITVMSQAGAETDTAAIVIKATGQDSSANTANSITCTVFQVQAIEQ